MSIERLLFLLYSCYIFGKVNFWKAAFAEINLDFHQSDYKINPERIEIVRYDKRIMKYLEIHTFKYNRTCTAFNLTMGYMQDIKEMEIVVQSFKLASNEYRLFPIRFQFNFCYAISRNMFGFKRFYNCGNFSGCNIEKGSTFHICNWTIDETRFPPLIPTGSYMHELQLVHLTHESAVVQAYGIVVRPLV